MLFTILLLICGFIFGCVAGIYGTLYFENREPKKKTSKKKRRSGR